MPPIDVSIYQNLLRPPKSVAEYDAEAMQGQQNRLALQMGQQKADEYTRSVSDGNKLRQVVSGFGADKGANYNALLQSGRLPEAQAYAKQNADLEKTGADVKHLGAQTAELDLKAVGLASQQHKDMLGAVSDPQTAAQWVAAAYNDPRLAAISAHGGTLEQAIARIPTDPKAFADWKMQSSLGADKLIEYSRANANIVANNQTSIATNTATNNRVAAEGRLNRQQADMHFNTTPKGQITQTDAGTMLVDPRTGQATPVTLAGQPLGAKLKEIPASVNTAIIANIQSLSQLDKTIALLEGKSVSGQAGDSAATGIKGYLPQQILNAVDPQGIDARAGVADIGSLKLHDRSGAAVTASESPRLMPFIPLATDNNTTALKKLKRLKQEVESESAAMGDTYSKEQGYRPNPVLMRKAAPPAGKPSLSDIFGK